MGLTKSLDARHATRFFYHIYVEGFPEARIRIKADETEESESSSGEAAQKIMDRLYRRGVRPRCDFNGCERELSDGLCQIHDRDE